ncbi:MAG: hypothetical protein HY863_20510 [Chloroflexi bacterium]|nr:hypothetical protein [Chloroflexota bacterium]
MNKLDVSPPTFTVSTVSQSEPLTHSESSQRSGPASRLIVLFPSSEMDTPDLVHRIWEIARFSKLNVLLLGLSSDYGDETQLRRKLVTMAAVIKDPHVSTEIMIGHGNDWVKQVKNIWQAGDVVACYAGHKVGLTRKPLDQILTTSLGATIYILSEYQRRETSTSTFLSKASPWLGSLAIIGGFFWAEVKIVQLPQDWAHNALIYACIVVEVILVWAWNLLFT